jgi:hypothetical protein
MVLMAFCLSGITVPIETIFIKPLMLSVNNYQGKWMDIQMNSLGRPEASHMFNKVLKAKMGLPKTFIIKYT